MARYVVETGLTVPLRDGVALATDVYRPEGGPVPALLARTPYDKERVAGWSDDLDLFRSLRAGYAVVVQDVRGRYASPGVRRVSPRSRPTAPTRSPGSLCRRGARVRSRPSASPIWAARSGRQRPSGPSTR
jgi:X-Pro dipeptidyl-peptidase (S15 family)